MCFLTKNKIDLSKLKWKNIKELTFTSTWYMLDSEFSQCYLILSFSSYEEDVIIFSSTAEPSVRDIKMITQGQS